MPSRRIVTGGPSDPLLSRLHPALDAAVGVDLALAFIFDAGVNLLHARLVDILRRPHAQIRILTGDYQGVTEPNALRHLLALPTIANPTTTAATLHLRVYRVKPDRRDSFHPKVWIIRSPDHALAWIGSSNMSETALKTGLEWSYELSTPDALAEARAAFDELWHHPSTEPITADWIDTYERTRRPPTRGAEALPIAVAQDAPVPAAQPRPGIQSEALLKLQQTRQAGEHAGLVVLATGLGKTYVSAFDSQSFRRVLFVAHREEILTQALETFRKVRPSARLGLYHGTQKDPHADVLFASIQTLSSDEHLESFDPTHFDYVIVDEFHHASAETYRRVLDHFEPTFLLGLTATPDRTDGANILSLCAGNEVYRADMPRGIADGQLSAFRYFGIGDPTAYEKIPWRSYTEDRLAATIAIESRAQHILESLEKHAPGRVRALAFCVTTGHADFMAQYFIAHGRPKCAAVYAGSDAPRTASLESLARGELEIAFCVDMFNEGVDIPNIDTVMMLRPTESSIVWLQQLGRGLRRVEGKTLTVLDFIGNHEVFGRRPEMLFEMLKIEIKPRDEPWREGFREAELPPGVEIHFDLEARDILTALREQSAKAGSKGERWYAEFHAIHGVRPTALEAWHAGWFKDLARKGGGWLAFVASRGHLDPDSLAVFEQLRDFFAELEALKQTNSHTFLVLRALLHLEPFPGRILKREIADWIAAKARRSPAIMRDLAVDGTDAAAVERALESAFAELAQLGGGALIRDDAKFLDASPLAKQGSASALASLVGELVDLHVERWLEDVSKSSMKLPKILADDGKEIDARFDIEMVGEHTTIVFHSRGETSASAGARNTEYRRGLETILQRLGRSEIDIERIEVDSSELIRRGLPLGERTLAIQGHSYPLVSRAVSDHAALARAIGNAMRKIGQKPGTSGGNDTKRLRITLVQSVPAGELWRRLRS